MIKKWTKMIAVIGMTLVMAFMCFACVGADGPAGPKGDKGDQGIQGEQGIQGPKGDTGTKGEQGDTGLPGKDGQDFTVEVPAGTPIIETKIMPTGVTSGFLENGGKFNADNPTLDEHRNAASKLNIEIAEEAFALLKNDNAALPLTKNETKLTLFGIRSYNAMTGGGGSGAGSSSPWMNPVKLTVNGTTHGGSLENSGFTVNPVVKSLYTFNGTTEINIANLQTSTAISSYGLYNDAAIVSFGRAGAEGDDVATTRFDSETYATHALELTAAEKAVVTHAKKYFKKVIVLLQTNNVIEVAELQAEKTAGNLGVDAIILTGLPGANGYDGIGRILNGTLCPSGNTVDIWAADLMKGPEMTNFGRQWQHADSSEQAAYDYDAYNTLGAMTDAAQTRANDKQEDIRYYYLEDGRLKYQTHSPQSNQELVSVEYREDIYMGYRYYETVAAEMDNAEAGSGDAWYKEAVVYPFGYGMSYTKFDWKFTKAVKENAPITEAHQTITLDVQVTNTGGYAGKDVVQIYCSAPYTAGGVEKSHVKLVDFAKTKLLNPGESQILRIQFVAQDMASFDYDDKAGSGFKGYKLEAGNYIIGAYRDSHTPVATVTRAVASTINCTKDYTTGADIKPVFSGGISGGEGFAMYDSMNQTLKANKMTRDKIKAAAAEGVAYQAAVNTKADRTVTKAQYEAWLAQDTYFSFQDKTTDPWYISQVPAGWDQGKGTVGADGMYPLTLADMAGVPYTGVSVNSSGAATAATDEDTQKWDAFMNQLTWDEMYTVVTDGNYGQREIPTIGKRLFNDSDGPAQMGGYLTMIGRDRRGVSGMAYLSAATLAQTFNPELAYKYGRSIGGDSIYGNMPGWYAVSMNTHRSPFSGRNFEYYSEDGVLAGKIAAGQTLGATSKGVVCYIKHMFLNDQEFGREPLGGIFTWASEQAIREIYLKPYEYAIKFGRSLGIMTAFNRIGAQPSAANYAQNEQIVRDEWGFSGAVVTDSWNGQTTQSRRARPMNLMVRTGGDLPLGSGNQSNYLSTTANASLSAGRLYGLEGQTVPLTPGQTPGRNNTLQDMANDTWSNNPAGWSAWDATRKGVWVAPSWVGDKRMPSTVSGSLSNALRADTADNGKLIGETGTRGTDSNYTFSPTHYYAVRKSAQRILYSNANSNHLRNGYADPSAGIDSGTVSTVTLGTGIFAAEGVNGTFDIPLGSVSANRPIFTLAGLRALTGSDTIALADVIIVPTGTLPAGLSISGVNLTGAPTATAAAANQQVNIDIFLPGGYRIWNSRLTINLIASMTAPTATATLNAAYSSAIVPSTNTAVVPAGATVAFTITSGALPVGLSLAPNGTIAGTPLQQGVFTYTIQMRVTPTTGSAVNYTMTYTLTVGYGT